MNQDNIWKYYQGEGIHNFDDHTPRLDYLFKKANQLLGRTPKNILNIGIGNGRIEKNCLENNLNIFSLDPTDHLSHEKVKSIKGKIERLPFSNDKFDIIFCSEVLEHLTDIQLKDSIFEIERVLIKNGILIGTVPNNEILFNNNIICPSCNHKFHRWGHHQTFDKNTLRLIFEKNYFDIDILKAKVFKDYSHRSLLNFLRYIVRVVFCFFNSPLIHSSIFFIVRKK
jgi:ubiquinone/menaquinone biosynthesis C-methylase UbiE